MQAYSSFFSLASLLLFSSLPLGGCGGAVDTPSEPVPSSPAGPAPAAPALVGAAPSKVAEPPSAGSTPFHLVLSNQSFESPLVDVRVLIDSVEVVRGDFHVKSQHAFYTFDFSLSPGAHTVQVSTSTGLATTTNTVTTVEGQERWAMSFYWTEGCGSAGACQRSLSWNVVDEAPLFD